jgi:small subunit ribosomal protein S16
MVKIRLKRLGRKKRPFYRIVVMDIRQRRQGAALAELGYFNPLSRELKLDKAAAQEWVSKGAQVSPTVERLLKNAPETGELIILEKAKKERLSKKQETLLKQQADAKANAEAEAKAAAAAPKMEEAPAPVEAAVEPVAEAPVEAPVAEAPAEEPAAETPAEEEPAAEEAPEA